MDHNLQLQWLIIYTLMLVGLSIKGCVARSPARDLYWSKREQIISEEKALQLGASLQLNENEQRVNDILMQYKLAELDASFRDPGQYLPSQHFFDARKGIARNKIFSILREMPKGGLLHTHDLATTNWDFLYNQTFQDDLYLCNDEAQQARLHFFDSPDASCNWRLVKDLRRDGGKTFEDYLNGQLTLIRHNYEKEFSDVNKVWRTFQNIFIFVKDLVLYKPVQMKQFAATLEQLYNDNVTYVEIRTTLSQVYNINGSVYSPEDTIQMYVDIAKNFKAENPNFLGVKLIYAPLRLVSNKVVEEYQEIARRIKAKFPNFVAGFDLVGQEDQGRPLVDFINELHNLDMDFYFHAGETNWNQALTDQNLIDAVLLGTKRIGHGYALIKHPELMRIVKQKKIAIEVSPISNQVLCLVKDLRNHPASVYMANDMPMVITNDDPTFWGAEGVSYDWYVTFMGIASRTADLRLLKQLAINSLQFSAMTIDEKALAMTTWQQQWDDFINRFLQQHISH